MRKTLLLAFVLGIFSGINAQEFSIRYINQTQTGSASNFELVTKAVLLNSGPEADFTWVRVKKDYAPNWESAICDLITCFTSGVDSNRFTLKTGDSSNIDLHFYPFNTPGSSTVDLLIYANEDRANGKIATFAATTWGVSAREISRTSEVELFPMPAVKTLTVRFGELQQTTLFVFDVLGKEVLRQGVNGREAIVDVSNLPNGMYILRYKNASGIFVSKKFKKAQ